MINIELSPIPPDLNLLTRKQSGPSLIAKGQQVAILEQGTGKAEIQLAKDSWEFRYESMGVIEIYNRTGLVGVCKQEFPKKSFLSFLEDRL